MKELRGHAFDATKCRNQLAELGALLSSKALSESRDVLPFFKRRTDLSMLIADYIPAIKNANVIAYEYPIYGHFKADLIVGDSSAHEFLLIEFEDGAFDSIFKKIAGKATLEWSPRFEHAFSQIIDWMWKLEDMRSSQDFQDAFGSRSANFSGLIVIGRDPLTGAEKARLRWRTDRVLVDSHKIAAVTFDGLYADLNFRLRKLYGIRAAPVARPGRRQPGTVDPTQGTWPEMTGHRLGRGLG